VTTHAKDERAGLDRRWLMTGVWLLTAVTVACTAGEPPRSEELDRIDRELAVALEGDSASATFRDMPVATMKPEAGPTQPAPPRETQRAAPPARPAPAGTTDREPVPPAAEPRPAEPAPREVVVRTGTLLRISLNDELSTRNNVVGDAFTATLVDPVSSESGEVLIPAGAVVRGRVVQVQASSRVGETAVLHVAFEALSFAGSSHPLDATVLQANPERVARQSTGEQVGKIAVGAAAGAIIGRVLGGKNRDAVKGAVVGAAAGTAIALGTADVDAVLKAGSLMVIQTESPITVVLGGGTSTQ